MTSWKSVLQIMGLAVAICLTQACQRTDQNTAENQPAAGGSAGAPNGAAPSGTPAPAPPASGGAAAANQPTAAPAAPAASKPAAPPKPVAITVPAGTVIKVRTTRTLSTKTMKDGDGFDAVLDEPLIAGGKELFPKGATVMVEVAHSDPGGRVQGVASLSVRLTMLHTADGQMVMVSTSPVAVQAKSTKKKDGEKVGVGAAIGAAIGAIAGGGKGAAIGAATGAGAGGAVVLGTRGDAAEIPSESVLNFSLSSPLTISR